jgi:predicted Zn-dependent peptidase
MSGTVSRAIALAQDTLLTGNPDFSAGRVRRMATIGAPEIQRAAGKYLVPANRVIVATLPDAAGRGGEP